MRILILRGGAIGDFIVTMPVLQTLKRTWPDCHIALVGYPHVARLALQCGLADEIRSLDEVGMARFFSWQPEFDGEQTAFVSSFDLVISFLHDPGDIVRRNLLKAGARLVIYRSPLVKAGHAVDHMLQALKDLPVKVESPAAPAISLPPPRLRRGRDLLQEFGIGQPALALHPGSGSPEKNWPLENYLELCERLGRGAARCFFLLGEADQEIHRRLLHEDRAPPAVSGLPLTDTAAVLAASAGYVGNDSGITHLAAALGVPTVAIFGPSDASRWGPRGRCVRILQSPDRRLRSVSVGEVASALRSLRGGS